MEKKIDFIYWVVMGILLAAGVRAAQHVYRIVKPEEHTTCIRTTEYAHQGMIYKIQDSEFVYICDGLLKNK